MPNPFGQLSDEPTLAAADVESIDGRVGQEPQGLKPVVDVVIPRVLANAARRQLRRRHSEGG